MNGTGTTQGANGQRHYLCIDLKSFYASVECIERGLDPMQTDLVVADASRTDKTICLAVSPSLKRKGVKNRCRVFEIPKHLDYIMAPPRMAAYIRHSAEIYGVYLEFVAKEDIHVYSIDEAFMDITDYLALYRMSPRELGEKIRSTVMERTGIPATCGLGPNLYLAKVALDITAKHSPDFFGELDEDSFKETLWNHRELTDFWRIGRGTERRLHELGIYTMGQLALYPDEDKLFDVFGIDAEILIDHAWGIEPVRIADIKAYRPQSHSTTNAQVLGCSYAFEDARIVFKEMIDSSCLDLVAKGSVCESVTIALRYEKDEFGAIGESRGSVPLPYPTNARSVIMPLCLELFDGIADRQQKIHNIMVNCNRVAPEEQGQTSLFAATGEQEEERRRQDAILKIKGKFGKNALLKGTDLMPQATQRVRNELIGGHRSGQ